MRIGYVVLAGAVAALAMAAQPAAAQETGRVGGALLAGSNGLGAELKVAVTPNVVLRGSVEGFGLSRDVTYEDIDYNGKLKLFTGGAFLDLHPSSGSGFFLSGGAYVGKRKVSIDARPTVNVEIGDQTYTPAQVGALAGSVEMSNLTPFAGLGWDSTFTSTSNWSFKVLAGVAFSGSPDVALASTGGTLSSNAAFQAELTKERSRISDDAKSFKYYPILTLGISRRF